MGATFEPGRGWIGTSKPTSPEPSTAVAGRQYTTVPANGTGWDTPIDERPERPQRPREYDGDTERMTEFREELGTALGLFGRRKRHR